MERVRGLIYFWELVIVALAVTVSSCSDPGLDVQIEGVLSSAPNPKLLSLRSISPEEVSLDWSSGGGTTYGYRIAFQIGSLAPSNCDSETTILENHISGTSHVISNLVSNAIYSFRICSVNSGGAVATSAGIVGNITTMPNSVQLLLSPTSGTAMNITGGSSPGASIVFTLTNSGETTSSVLGAPVILGTNSDNFTLLNENCSGKTLVESENCTFEVSPVANGNGSYSANLSISDGTTESNLVSLSSTSSGFIMDLAITATGNTSMDISGGSSPGTGITFTVTNNGASTSANLNGSFSITGTNPGNFSITANNCTTTLASSGSCTITIEPTATSNATYSANLTTSADDTPTISLSGTASGFPVDLAITAIGNTSMNIGEGNYSGTGIIFTVTNNDVLTSANLNGSFSLTGANPGNFNITANNCTNTLAPSGTCTITIEPTATISGSYSANLTTSANNTPTIALSGMTIGPRAILGITATGNTSMNISGGNSPGNVVTFTITNSGSQTSVTLSGTIRVTSSLPAGSFNIVENNCTTTLSPTVNCTLKIEPLASSNGVFSATLSTTANNTPTIVLAGTATGFLGNGTFSLQDTESSGTNPSAIGSADLNGNGHLDLVVADFGSASVGVYMNNTTGTMGAVTAYSVGGSPWALELRDYDKDGDIDIVVTQCSVNVVSFLANNGDGTFVAKVDYSTGVCPSGLFAGDLDGDGNIDLVVANKTDNDFSVLKGVGDGTFLSKVDMATSHSSIQAINGGDFDGDGIIDIVTASGNDSFASIFMGNGSGGFLAGVSYAKNGSYVEFIDVADLDKDGNLDFSIMNADGNANDMVDVFLGNSNGVFDVAVSYSATSGGGGIKSADLNADGNLDLVCSNYSSDELSVFLGVGDGSFGAPSVISTASPWGLDISDLNNDGKLDIIASDYDGNAIKIYHGN